MSYEEDACLSYEEEDACCRVNVISIDVFSIEADTAVFSFD
jgi:hypothetical protein